MATIIEDYVSFEVARLLKEKGFDGDTSSCYILEDSTYHIMSDKVVQNEYYESQDSNEHGHLIQAPTLQMAMKWLREVHCSIWDAIHWLYQVFVITPRTARNPYVDKILYTSYEQAVEAGILYALKNLIFI